MSMAEILSVKYQLGDAAIAAMKELAKEATAAWLLEHFGDNCPDFADGCPVCQRWKLFRDLFAE